MDPFVITGVVGLVILLGGLVFGDVVDGLFDALDVGGGVMSAPVVGGFLAAVGFVGWLTVETLGLLLAVALGAGGGVVVGGVAFVLVRALTRMPTDPAPRSSDLVGRPGTALTALEPERLGTVRVPAHGQQLQLSARSTEPIAAGDRVVVVEVTSPTSVLVATFDLDDTP